MNYFIGIQTVILHNPHNLRALEPINSIYFCYCCHFAINILHDIQCEFYKTLLLLLCEVNTYLYLPTYLSILMFFVPSYTSTFPSGILFFCLKDSPYLFSVGLEMVVYTLDMFLGSSGPIVTETLSGI